MWQKIKDNLLTIATSTYFLFWGIVIYNSYIGYKKFEEKEDLDFIQKVLNKSFDEIIFVIMIFTFISFFLIFALIIKKKDKLFKILCYLAVSLILLINIASSVFVLNGYTGFYLIYGTNKQIKQVFSSIPIMLWGSKSLCLAINLNRDGEVIEFLINKTAEVNAVDSFGRTPLSYAVVRNSPNVVRLLIKKGANINHQGKKLDQTTPLMNAIILNENINYKEKIVEFLINAGADFNLQSSDDRRALDYATTLYNHSQEMITLRTIELLLETGANPYLKPSEDFLSPYETAQKYENKELIELFEKYKDTLKQE